jgi:hypothetical protein
MVSKYSEKRHKAPCVAPECPAPGTKLVMVAGKLEWVCGAHQRKISQ